MLISFYSHNWWCCSAYLFAYSLMVESFPLRNLTIKLSCSNICICSIFYLCYSAFSETNYQTQRIYFTNILPVISVGISTFIILSIVGAMSANFPFSKVLKFVFKIKQGTGFVVWAVFGLPF